MRALAALLLLLSGMAQAVTQEQVMAGASKIYDKHVAGLRASYRLDDNERFAKRVAAIAWPLIEQAKRDYPDSSGWAWEVHTTSDAEENAFALAGGKLLIAAPYVDRLELNDAEIAMLVSHEICHAVLLHNLREHEEAIRLEPKWATRPYQELEDATDNDSGLMRKLAAFDALQEEEADREGMRLAARAGWRASDLARFFRKLEKHSNSPNFGSITHPAPSLRARAARELAAKLEAGH